jgi:hypothetical protein
MIGDFLRTQPGKIASQQEVDDAKGSARQIVGRASGNANREFGRHI